MRRDQRVGLDVGIGIEGEKIVKGLGVRQKAVADRDEDTDAFNYN